MMAHNYYYNPFNPYDSLRYAGDFSPFDARPRRFRRPTPSPPPLVRDMSATGDIYDPYIQALAEEQRARQHLNEAIRKEKEARMRRELAEGKARAEAEARARAVATERARREREAKEEHLRRERARKSQSMYTPFGGYFYPSNGLFASCDDNDFDGTCDAQEEEFTPFNYLYGLHPGYKAQRGWEGPQNTRTRPNSVETHSLPGNERRESSVGRSSVRSRSRPRSVVTEAVRNTSCPSELRDADKTLQVTRDAHTSSSPEKISIPIKSPEHPASVDDLRSSSFESKSTAARKIQEAYRAHAERKSAEKARNTALSQIADVNKKFTALKGGFSFPETLDFDESVPLTTSAELMETDGDEKVKSRPKLLYTSRNAPLHGYEDALLKLLQSLDAVESGGDPEIRSTRRSLVRQIETEMSSVDERVWNVWKESHPKAERSVVIRDEGIEKAAESTAAEGDIVSEQRDEDMDLVANDISSEVAGEQLPMAVDNPTHFEATTSTEPSFESPEFSSLEVHSHQERPISTGESTTAIASR